MTKVIGHSTDTTEGITIKSDAPSNLSLRGEFAYLLASTPKADDFDGETTVYLDDFEAAQSTIDMRSPSYKPYTRRRSWVREHTCANRGTRDNHGTA